MFLVTDAAGSAAAPVNTDAPSDSPNVGGQDAATPAASDTVTVITVLNPDSQHGGAAGTSGITAAPDNVATGPAATEGSADAVVSTACARFRW